LNEANNIDVQDFAPYLKHQPMKDDKTTAYVCRNYTCEEPTNDVERMEEMIPSPKTV
jgi:hypothetical protein